MICFPLFWGGTAKRCFLGPRVVEYFDFCHLDYIPLDFLLAEEREGESWLQILAWDIYAGELCI